MLLAGASETAVWGSVVLPECSPSEHSQAETRPPFREPSETDRRTSTCTCSSSRTIPGWVGSSSGSWPRNATSSTSRSAVARRSSSSRLGGPLRRPDPRCRPARRRRVRGRPADAGPRLPRADPDAHRAGRRRGPDLRARRRRRRLRRQTVRLRGGFGAAPSARSPRGRHHRPGTTARSSPAAQSRSTKHDDASRLTGRPVELTLREFSLLECLLRHPGHALSRDQLLDMAWPFGVAVTPNTVDAFITFLRRKLGPRRRRPDRDRARYRLPDGRTP